MPTIICPRCGTVNRPRGLSTLVCENCGQTIDPRQLNQTPETFVRKQRKLRKAPRSSLEPLGADEADELMEWALELPPGETDVGPTPPISGRAIGLLSRLRQGLRGVARRERPNVLYGDSIVSMRDDAIVIKRYYWPVGRKRIPYAEIRGFSVRPLKAWHGQFRVHGIDHLGRWYSRDRHRGEKERAIDLTVGWWIHPVLTPDDTDAVVEILEREVSTRSE